MSSLAITQALQALLPDADAAKGALPAAGPGASLRPGLDTAMGHSLLQALEALPLQTTLPPSLGETLLRTATPPVHVLPEGNPLSSPHEARPDNAPTGPQALEQMAQAASPHDIAAERHGRLDAPGPPASVHTDANAAAPAPSSRAEPLATPLAREVVATTAVASLLHVPAARQRDATAPAPSTPRDRRDGDGPADDTAHDGNLEPPQAQDGASLESDNVTIVTAATQAPADRSTGAATLYESIVAALRAARDAGGPVAIALDELKRQRRVVLATPVSLTPGLRCLAHVDVLVPTAGSGRAVRLSGELLWSQVTSDTVWWQAHLVKSQGHGNVRQLVPVATQADTRRIAVCLGAHAIPMTAWSHACLRVRDGTRLWRALEPQWSLRLILSSLPLVLTEPPSPEGVLHAR